MSANRERVVEGLLLAGVFLLVWLPIAFIVESKLLAAGAFLLAFSLFYAAISNAPGSEEKDT